MSAKEELIATALTAADELDRVYENAPVEQNSNDLREACARAMCVPDMAERDALIPDLEEEDLLAAYYAGEESGYRRGRKEATQPVSATEVLMPPKCHPLHKLGQRLAELLDENQWAECERLLLECWKHEQKPSAAEVPMPQGYAERPADYSGGIWIESQMRQYGDAREAAGYARGLAEAGKDAERYRWLRAYKIKHNGHCMALTGPILWEENLDDVIDAALHGEVKP